jgi:O-antigen/teichoic acid export membrane protein
VLINTVVGAVLGFVSLYFIAHYMGETVLGIIGFSLSFIGLFSFITNLGYDSAHVKRVSEGKELGTCLGTYISVKLILIAVMSGTAFIGILLWRGFSNGGNDPEKELVLFLILVYYIILTLVQMMGHTFIARREIAKSQITNITEHVTKAPLVVAIAVTLPLGVSWLAGAYIFGVFASFFVALLLIWGYPINRPNREMFRSYTKFALPIFLVSMTAIISLNIDKVMLEHFWGTEYVGYYYGSQRIIDIVRNFSVALGIVLFPTISYYASKNRRREIGKVVGMAERYLSMMIFPITMFIIILRNEIVELILGTSFIEVGAPVLAALAVFILLVTLAKPYNVLIAGIDRPFILARIGVAVATTNILLNLLLIPDQLFGSKMPGLGAFGAALATIFSHLLLLVLYYNASRKLTGIRPNSRILLHFFAALITGIVLFSIAYLLSAGDIWSGIRSSGDLQFLYHLGLLIILGIATFIIYLGLLAGMKEFRRKDVHFFFDLLHPGKMGEYIKKELKGEEKKS